MRFLITSFFAAVRWLLGMKREEATVGDMTWSYLDNHLETDKPVVVVLHGFSSVKESMLRAARPLLHKYRVIMPDLPGHGDTSCTLGSYRAEEQADRLHAFLVHLLGPTAKVHIMGCSMGGMVSGVFAARHSDMLVSVTLICPAGVTMPTKSPMFQIYEDTGANYMRIEKPEDFDRLQMYMSFKERKLPRFVSNFVAQEADRRRQVLEELMRDILLDFTVLDSCLENIDKPCLVMWGDHDKILDPSCLDIVRKKMPTAQLTVHVIENAGHIVHQEHHAEVGSRVFEFIEALPSAAVVQTTS